MQVGREENGTKVGREVREGRSWINGGVMFRRYTRNIRGKRGEGGFHGERRILT